MQNLINAALRGLKTKKGLALALPGVALLALLGSLSGSPSKPPAASQATSAPAASAAAAPATAVASATAETGSFSAAQTKDIQKIIRDYLVKNPEIMLEVQTALQAKSEEMEAARLKVAIKDNAAELFRRSNAAITGNPKGDVTIVEFFDYNCGYCKRALGDLAKLVESDAKLRVVFKELPILSKGSEEATRVALAARMQGKYWELHRALLEARGRANAASAIKEAEKLGLDIPKLKTDMASAEVTKEIADTRTLAQKMGINGTPHFIIGDKAIPGAPENLNEMLTGYVKDIRAKGCAVC